MNKQYVAKLILGCGLAWSSIAQALISDIELYRGAQLVKSVPEVEVDTEIPLAKIQRVGRGWEPEVVQRVVGNVQKNLYKIGRNVPLENVIEHYREALQSLDGATVEYQCESRSCGSSNAWANSFFKDYLLYGPDGKQFLMVVSEASGAYQVLYINRRGAGDIMVRLDEIVPEQDKSVDLEIVAQMSASDQPRIRRFLDDLSNDERVVGFVTSSGSLDKTALAIGDETIETILAGLNDSQKQKVKFVNIANLGRATLGDDRIIFIYSQ
ncbi:DUF4892 domain-containing protein [Marinomonas mediterranea]|uniref:DUF4892 domain-containing protein n=1 Tax=Marinomonas mediterranea TaxID=119864 RepID=UPI0023495E05|nr:DUF4892 domain-containing protein [Marinomonas mediterranea]WCN09450.1 DUF4892 domain-containing protein [Marinomonas mediterranea]